MRSKRSIFAAGLCLFISACSSSGDSTKFGGLEGKVTHMGAPLADAQLTFVPENGPVAFSTTDAEGKYKAGGKRGVAAGNVRIAVKVTGMDDDSSTLAPELSKQPSNPQEAQDYLKKAGEMQKEINAKLSKKSVKKSPIPKRYATADSSGLTVAVEANKTTTFDIPLKE